MQYLLQILHLSCQVQRLPGYWAPWSVVRNKMAERFASVSEDELCEKCIIKQLLNSVFAWYLELSKPRVCAICLSFRLCKITQTSVLIIHDIMPTSSNNCLMSNNVNNFIPKFHWHCYTETSLNSFGEVGAWTHQKAVLLKSRYKNNYVEQCHEDFAVLGQFCAKITTLRLQS